MKKENVQLRLTKIPKHGTLRNKGKTMCMIVVRETRNLGNLQMLTNSSIELLEKKFQP